MHVASRYHTPQFRRPLCLCFTSHSPHAPGAPRRRRLRQLTNTSVRGAHLLTPKSAPPPTSFQTPLVPRPGHHAATAVRCATWHHAPPRGLHLRRLLRLLLHPLQLHQLVVVLAPTAVRAQEEAHVGARVAPGLREIALPKRFSILKGDWEETAPQDLL